MIPEKIYLGIGPLSGDEPNKKYLYAEWYEEPKPLVKNIEYIRTDAFINKAVQWLEAHADDYDYTWYDEMTGESGLTAKCIDDFKNYMKG